MMKQPCCCTAVHEGMRSRSDLLTIVDSQLLGVHRRCVRPSKYLRDGNQIRRQRMFINFRPHLHANIPSGKRSPSGPNEHLIAMASQCARALGHRRSVRKRPIRTDSPPIHSQPSPFPHFQTAQPAPHASCPSTLTTPLHTSPSLCTY